MSGILFVSSALSLVIFTVLFMPEPIHNTLVSTSSGTIKGNNVIINNKQIRTFFGIPYAKPPIAKLRFKKPVPIEPWTTVLQANALPAGCIQSLSNPFPWVDDQPGLSEDCLYLNIWAPEASKDSEKKTVMFFIHGGGFRISSNRLDFYNGEILAAEGDVIVVTTNYRLGAFGFFYSNTSEAPGNVGMLDLVEALKWVRKNIEYFGGDKDSITLFGQSAGGIAIGMFSVSPLTKRLFKRAIMQGGSPANMDGEDNDSSYKISQKLAKLVGCADRDVLENMSKNVVSCMRKVKPFEIAEGLAEVTKNQPRSYYPRYGDDFLPTNVRQAVADGKFTATDLLIGANNGDGATLLTKSMKEVFGFFGEKNPKINRSLAESIIKKKVNYPDTDSVVDQYLGDVGENEYDEMRFKVFTALGDFSALCPSVYFAESYAKEGAKVYFYFYTHQSSNRPWAPWMLAAHFDETPYVFGYPIRYPGNYTANEVLFSRRIVELWSSFAKTGVPNDSLWNTYSKENPTYLILDVDSNRTGYGPHQGNCNLFRSYFGF